MDRQIDRQDRQTDRQTDRHIDIHIHKNMSICKNIDMCDAFRCMHIYKWACCPRRTII